MIGRGLERLTYHGSVTEASHRMAYASRELQVSENEVQTREQGQGILKTKEHPLSCSYVLMSLKYHMYSCPSPSTINTSFAVVTLVILQ